MELEKKSNLRSLIPAVLVGLLALAANEYTKMDPAVLRESVAPVVCFLQPLRLDHGAHRPIQHEDALLQRLFQVGGYRGLGIHGLGDPSGGRAAVKKRAILADCLSVCRSRDDVRLTFVNKFGRIPE